MCSRLFYNKIASEEVTHVNLVNFMHACLNLVGSITQTGILLHLLQLLLVVVVVSVPGTLLAPFRVDFALLLHSHPLVPPFVQI